MAGRISIANAGKYGSNNGSDFFTLSDDGDIARVRMLYDQPDGSDLDYYLIHEVEIDGRKRYIACNAIGEDGSLHPDNCPLCKSKYRRIEKLFLQMYHEDEDKNVVWERGRNFVNKIQTYINRYGSLVQQAIEIERHGKKGDTNTTYELFPMEVDGKTLEDFPEKQDLVGSLILELTEDEMYDVVDGRYHPDGEQQQTTRRRPSRNERQGQPAPQPRPASTQRRDRVQSEDVAPEKQKDETVPEAQEAEKPAEQPRRTIRRGRGRTSEF